MRENKASEQGASPSSHLYKVLSKVDWGKNIKARWQHAVPLNDSLLPATVALLHTIKQVLVSTCGKIWQMILNHLSEMGQQRVPSV